NPEFLSHHWPGSDVRGADPGRSDCLPDTQRRSDGGAGLCRAYVPGGAFCNANDHRPPARTQRPRSVHRARVLDLAMGTDGWLPLIAAADRWADPQGASDARGLAAAAAGLTSGSAGVLSQVDVVGNLV